MQSQYIFFGLIAIWLLGLSIFIYWIYSHINPLLKESRNEPFIKVLEKLVSSEKENTGEIIEIKRELARLDKKNLLHIQKIGVIRFNPFNETGGDHSFSVAILDANDTGIVLTGLHTRERTRLYIKKIVRGKSEHDLSKEEVLAIKKAEIGKD